MIYSHEEAMNASMAYFNQDSLASNVFIGKYALRNEKGELLESNPEQMHRRLAKEFARIEAKYPNPLSEEEIFSYLDQFSTIIPQGSPMAGIGNNYQVMSLGNCFTLPPPHDSYSGICFTDQQQAQIMKRRGGVGYDISPIRPKGQRTENAAGTTDGIGIFMERFSNTCREVAQNGRRGALLLSCHVKHPEISTFINIKKDKKKVTGANVSVRFSDDFMLAVKSSESYTQQFPVDSTNPKISFKTEAKKIWEEFINASWESAEPGALFWDTVQRLTPSDIYKLFGFQSVGVNPCAELILAAYDSCRLLLINLFGFIKDAFLPNASFDKEAYFKAAVVAQRLMDDLVDLELECIDKILSKIESDPEPDNVKAIEKELWLNIKKVCQNGRRTGTGITAIGDVLAALGIRYGSDESIEKTEELYKELAKATYTSSIIMAKERGAFPVCNVELEKGHPFIERILAELPEDIKEMYYKHGRRNIANTTTAPAGSVSLVARLIPGYFQTTSGIEPCVQPEYTRRKKINQNDKDTKVDFVDEMGDRWTEFKVYHPGFKLWKDITGKTEVKESPYFKATINDVDWKAGVQLQAAAQKWVCHSISKTVNLPKDASKELISEVFLTGWELGCKGLTVYRDGCRDGVLILDDNKINKEETIVSHHAPKRKKELNCDIHHATINGEKWTIFVGLLGKIPYEIIGGLAKYVSIPKRVKSGKIVKINGTTVPARYDLHYDYESPEEETVIKDIGNVFENSTQETFTRTLSLSLRHGVPIQYIVEQLQKDNGKDSDLFSFNKGMARVLKKYIVDGTKASQKTCDGCNGTELIYKEGCVSCLVCGWSKCS